MLGVQLMPSLNWSSQVEKMIIKVQSAVIKLVNTELTMYQAFMQFNTYLKPSVYYSAGIIQITEAQDYRIRQICKQPLLKKLQMNIKILNEVLYMRRNAFGLGFIKLTTVVAMAIMKSFISHCRLQTEICNLIKFNIEAKMLETGIPMFPYQMDSKY